MINGLRAACRGTEYLEIAAVSSKGSQGGRQITAYPIIDDKITAWDDVGTLETTHSDALLYGMLPLIWPQLSWIWILQPWTWKPATHMLAGKVSNPKYDRMLAPVIVIPFKPDASQMKKQHEIWHAVIDQLKNIGMSYYVNLSSIMDG